MKEPLTPPEVKARLRKILESGGSVTPSAHALQEMKKDGMELPDAINVLRGGVAEPGEFEHGSWRYRVRTAKMYVVIAFASETEVVLVSGWRIQR